MRIQDMPNVLRYVFNIVDLYGSKSDITEDDINTILESVKSCIMLEIQVIGGILH